MDWKEIVYGAGWAIMALFAVLTAVEAVRYFRTAMFPGGERRAPEKGEGPLRLAAMLASAWLLSRLFMLLVLAVCQLVIEGGFAGFGGHLSWFTGRWDARHYQTLIREGYAAEGDSRLLLVFLPLYPMLCRGIHLTTGLAPKATAMLVSNLCLMGCGGALYALALEEGSRALARRAVLLFFFCPVTFFYSMPYSESLFLLMTLLSALCARRRRWIPAVLFGALAANARLLGMATAVPIFWEMLRCARRAPKRPMWRDILRCALAVLPVSAGLIAYLGLNVALHGNALQFLTFQREQWTQSAGTLAWSFRVSFVNMLSYEKPLYRLGVWGPQAILLPGVPLLIALRRRRERPADAAYALIYHYVSYMPTWLLSGARYTSAMYPLYLMLARAPRGRKGFACMFAGECLLLAYATVVGLWFGHVM